MSNLQRKLFGSKPSSRLFQYLIVALGLQLLANDFLYGQDNSPYSRYGIGDLHPNTNIFNRAMGGISAAYSDQPSDADSDPRNDKYYPSINFLNPASYSRFFAIKERNTNKLRYGRMMLDLGVNFTNRTLREENNPQNFTSTNAYFSYMQIGMPIKKNWGLVLGLRPLSTISYKVDRNERLYDPNTGSMIDSAKTRFTGEGGSYLFNTGTGIAFGNFSIGINAGYLFGKKDYSTRRVLVNDTVSYSASNHQTQTNIGGIFLSGGLQYRIDLSRDKLKYIQLGAYGNMENVLDTKSDIIRETFFVDPSDNGEVRLDSVFVERGAKGKLNYPSNIGAGVIIEQLPTRERSGWLIGADFLATDWNEYHFNGIKDDVRSNWQVRIGGQVRPAMKTGYKSYVSYRAGFFIGDDYVYAGNQKLPVWGVSAGASLPILNLKDNSAAKRFRTQFSIINISAEYIRRGNSENPIYEDQFRLSVGFTLSDLWFSKRKYE